MRKRLLKFLLIAGLCILPAMARAGERKEADIACKATDLEMVYDCMITLKGRTSGDPIAGAEFMVGADMPSMPGIHTVKPVPAQPHGMPGMYQARIHLEMFGEWALRLDFTKPDRDRVVKKFHFAGKGDHVGHTAESGMDHDMDKDDVNEGHKMQGHSEQEDTSAQ